jgi:hypothetical protein
MVRKQILTQGSDWVHDRYDDDTSAPRGGYSRPRGRRDEHESRYDSRDMERDRYACFVTRNNQSLTVLASLLLQS